MCPLETRLEGAANAPIGVAEMIVDGRIFRLELDCAFELLDRLLLIAAAEIGPAQRVDDIAVVRPLLHGALDH